MPAMSEEFRNVVVVGKTGVGKSSVANAISAENDDNRPFPVSDSSDSCTKRATLGESYLVHQSVTYSVKLVDTVGLFDTGSLTNKATIQQIKEFAKNKIPEGVSVILFVIAKGRFTKEEHDTLDFLIENFGADISSISALIITHCEGMSPEARNKVVREWKQDKKTKKYVAYMGRGIYTVGLPDLKVQTEALRSAHKQQVEEDRQFLRSIVFSSEKKMSLSFPKSSVDQDKKKSKGKSRVHLAALAMVGHKPKGATETVAIKPDPTCEASNPEETDSFWEGCAIL